MTEAADSTPWYVAGLSFTCAHCGRCCAGPEEGYVWVTAAEVSAIAAHLGVDEAQVRELYVRRVGGRTSLRERSDTHDCVFLTDDGNGGRVCAVYPVRPTQCRTWPFWPINLRSTDAWARAGQRCPGINRGQHYDCDEIQSRRDATR